MPIPVQPLEESLVEGNIIATSAFERYRLKVWIYGVVATSVAAVAGIIILLIQNLS